jgi:hypothetical protein
MAKALFDADGSGTCSMGWEKCTTHEAGVVVGALGPWDRGCERSLGAR